MTLKNYLSSHSYQLRSINYINKITKNVSIQIKGRSLGEKSFHFYFYFKSIKETYTFVSFRSKLFTSYILIIFK